MKNPIQLPNEEQSDLDEIARRVALESAIHTAQRIKSISTNTGMDNLAQEYLRLKTAELFGEELDSLASN